ncbi:metalloreductase STEAP4-like isoform X2 [Procambarus clarkii]|uniref:metalloreductase STEAP4-like isoform X2 n=1 Tax=Procambarus clarkii TaxID=6728 RepID=UPI00374419E0
MDVTGPRVLIPSPPSLDLSEVTLQLHPGQDAGEARFTRLSNNPNVNVPLAMPTGDADKPGSCGGYVQDARSSGGYSHDARSSGGYSHDARSSGRYSHDARSSAGYGHDPRSNGKNRVSSNGVTLLNTHFPPYDPRFSLASTLGSIQYWNLPSGDDGRKMVVVMGSGDFGLALTARLAKANYDVIVASRDPHKNRSRVAAAGGRTMTQTEALQKSNLVILAVPFQHVSTLPFTELSGKILVDVSNRDPKTYDPSERSQAEHLQMLVPSARVVKALNVLSAYTLSSGVRGSKEVPVCGDDALARVVVCDVVRTLNLDPLDRGPLKNARDLEAIPFIFFPEWKFAFVVSCVVWIIAFFITFFEWQLCGNLRSAQRHNGSFNWNTFNDIATRNVSVSCAVTSLTLLALCYLPGVIAAYVQLARGTKYSQFPRWLDRWLKARKHLGLLMLFNAVIHVLAMLARGELYSVSDGWRGPTYVACGIVAFTLAGVLGLASLPSVAASMTWREFSFLQSRVGWLTLLLATFHIIFMVWDGLVTPHFICFFPTIGQVVVVVPVVTLTVKLPLLFPCVDSALTRLRQGYDRGSSSCSVKSLPQSVEPSTPEQPSSDC